MKRRGFFLASASMLSSGSVLSVNREPVVGVEFELSTIPERDPSNINSVMVDFSGFKLTPRYIDYSESLSVEIVINIDGNSKTVSEDVSLARGEIVNKEDISSQLPIRVDGVETSEKSINVNIEVNVSNSSIGTETYNQSFTITDNPIMNGLVSYYPVSNNGSTVIYDAVGDRNGQISGASWSTDTAVGSHSLRFQGGDSINIPSPVDPTEKNDNFSISFWAKPKSGEGSAPILEYSTGSNDLHIWQYDSENDFYLNPKRNSNRIGRNNGEIALDQWSHYTVLYDDSDGEYRLYRDGTRVQTSSQPNVTSDMSSDNLLIGTRIGDNRYYRGYLNSIRIYNRTLSKSEIESLASLNNRNNNNGADNTSSG